MPEPDEPAAGEPRNRHRVVPLDLDDPALARRLWAVQRAAYRVEAALIGSDEIPPLAETVEDLRRAGLRWRGVCDEDGAPVGGVATARPQDQSAPVDVERLVVDPAHGRQGVGRALVRAVLDEAAASGRDVVVSTGRDNAPARRLYEALGFRLVGEREAAPGLVVVTCRWSPDAPRRDAAGTSR